MEEKWKTIEGYPNYQVSSLGRVKSIERKEKYKNVYRTRKEKILKPNKHSNGYLLVKIFNEGKAKKILIHRLVASAFVQNNSLFNNEVNHLDENKENNCASNLDWCTTEQNCNFGTRNERISKANKNGKKSKAVICIETSKIYPSTREIQRQFGFNQSSIQKCCVGKQKTSYGYHWRYVD